MRPPLLKLAAAALCVLTALMAGSNTRAQTPPQQFQALQNQVNALQSQVTTLQGRVNSLQSTVNNLQSTNTALNNQITTLQSKLINVIALNPYVSVDATHQQNGVAGPHITFRGANVHIVNGLNSTTSVNGLGNLIIGYDEVPGSGLGPTDRGGSHNLVIGPFHAFTQAALGGFVAGEQNTISNQAASVTGGQFNSATGPQSSVTGGQSNQATGPLSSVSGGAGNTASGGGSSVTGGELNTAAGNGASGTGGQNNTAASDFQNLP